MLYPSFEVLLNKKQKPNTSTIVLLGNFSTRHGDKVTKNFYFTSLNKKYCFPRKVQI